MWESVAYWARATQCRLQISFDNLSESILDFVVVQVHDGQNVTVILAAQAITWMFVPAAMSRPAAPLRNPTYSSRDSENCDARPRQILSGVEWA